MPTIQSINAKARYKFMTDTFMPFQIAAEFRILLF